MVTIGIVRSTGSLQGDLVLRGVYGNFTPGEIEGGVGTFQIAPEFKRISHLFSLLDSGQSPVSPRDIHSVEVEDHQEHLAKAQLMHALATRWTKMYERVSPGQVGPLQSMLNAESANAANGAKSHLISMGMRAYLVPVSCEMICDIPGDQLPGERDLIRALREPRNISLAEGQIVDLGSQPLGTMLQQPARDELPPPADAAGAAPTAWAAEQFAGGVIAQVRGSIMVLATSMQQAQEAAQVALRLSDQAQATGVALEFIPEEIVSVQPLPEETFNDDDFDPDFEERDSRDRE